MGLVRPKKVKTTKRGQILQRGWRFADTIDVPLAADPGLGRGDGALLDQRGTADAWLRAPGFPPERPPPGLWPQLSRTAAGRRNL